MCNAWNHSAGCMCGFGGEGHLGGGGGFGFGNVTTDYASHTYGSWSERTRYGSFESYVNPNAKCPVCGCPVFFYQSPYGGRVFFDDLGPPWPKHPCTDNSQNYARVSLNSGERRRLVRPRQYQWQLDGYLPLISPSLWFDKYGRLEIKGKLASSKRSNSTKAYVVYLYTDKKYLEQLRYVPLLIRALESSLGQFEIATYELSRETPEVTPIFIPAYIPKPWRESFYFALRDLRKEAEAPASKFDAKSSAQSKQVIPAPPKEHKYTRCPYCKCKVKTGRLGHHTTQRCAKRPKAGLSKDQPNKNQANQA